MMETVLIDHLIVHPLNYSIVMQFVYINSTILAQNDSYIEFYSFTIRSHPMKRLSIFVNSSFIAPVLHEFTAYDINIDVTYENVKINSFN